ncbi:hypothetical protein JJD41_07460 [Oxynema sp. CENA135]|jgi:hypothetical protein|uniref:Uncharacterized protein n=1 Tax=Oxynema aestuarii AP17 TaxID=2064643 RepID=A0A6H1U112_9CYAN|nr:MULTISPECIES: hypothetical protein [Oxynema]MBK4729705.1 hypothetical protein [Oxynema sp. CENA135]QIZ71309.1 hypothetical protein HCG48_12540 [Oxynema aestuarii AP17]
MTTFAPTTPTAKTTGTVEQIVDRICRHRKISRYDQQLLMSALLSKDAISENERSQINRVFDNLQRGCLRVVD